MAAYTVHRVVTGSRGLGGGMPIVEHAGTSIRITFHLQKAMGCPDRNETYEIACRDIDALPPAPATLAPPTYWTLDQKFVRIPVGKRTIVFVYEDSVETYSSPWSEEDVIGPFVEPNEAATCTMEACKR